MKNKEKLLLVSAISPFPADSGGAVRIYETIKHLSAKYELYLIFFTGFDYQFSADEQKFLKQHTQVFTTFFIGEQRHFSQWRFGQPYWFSPWYHGEIVFTINQMIDYYQLKKVRLEFTQLLYLRDYIPSGCETVFVAHDISTVSFARRLAEEKNLGKTWLNRRRLMEIEKYERRYLPQFDVVIAMSETDAEELKKFDVKNIKISPNGIDKIKILPPTKGKTLHLGYIGAFSHTPNQRAVEYFVKKIAPQLEAEHFDYKYYLAGKNDAALIKEWFDEAGLSENKNFINLGFVEDTEDFFRKIDVLLVTLNSGSGTRIKVMEALGFGKKVVSTAIGAEGISAADFEIEIADTPTQLVQAVMNFDKNSFKPQSKKLENLTWAKTIL